tara:strand:+ start:1163 stop:1429 length:267 start_codon:yes stop_codon:yes gene_type:complete
MPKIDMTSEEILKKGILIDLDPAILNKISVEIGSENGENQKKGIIIEDFDAKPTSKDGIVIKDFDAEPTSKDGVAEIKEFVTFPVMKE